MRLSKYKLAALLGVSLTLVGAAAYALWTSTGTGGAGAKALTAQTITVSASSGTADLYPGFTQGDLFFTSANTNPYPVTFTSMTPGSITSSDQTNCPAANVSVVSASGLSIVVPAGATASPGTVANVVTMAAGAPDGCQGVVFTISLTLTGSQS
ncbi:MAG TPA: hypothetical protein VHN36_13410 [Ilumatobacteraceae bacterium]|nr:hypothetical protein [Ilumatobacteraceae bacterium]